MVRVTLAGFGGSIIGVAQHRKLELLQEAQYVQDQALRSTTTNMTNQTRTKSRRRGPPIRGSSRPSRPQKIPTTTLPAKWAFSCMAFVAVLETSKILSPSTWFVRQCELFHHRFPARQRQFALTDPMARSYRTIADYTLGGAIAGLTGVLVRRRHWQQQSGASAFFLPPESLQVVPPTTASSYHKGRRGLALIVWGLTVGSTLGCLVGLFQAGIDAGNAYLEEAEQEPLPALSENQNGTNDTQSRRLDDGCRKRTNQR